MSINIGPADSDELRPKITVIGVGGAGGNAIANMIAARIEGVDFIVANTDAQALNTAVADTRIQLGPEITGGLGAGARPEVGKAAAEETVGDIEEALEGVNMCFIAAGMGGGTGTGAAAVIAEAARRKGVLTVGVVTKPFLFEGTRRMRAAEAGIEELQKQVDTLIVIPNQNLFLIAKADTTFKEAFQLADEVLQQGVRSITDLMVMPGLINLDFADVKSVMEEMGKAMMGTGEGEGENRALEAAERAIANPLLDGVSMQGAKGVIISIIGGEDMKLLEVDEAANHIRELVDEDANIIWGSAFNPNLDGKIRVSVVATGIEPGSAMAEPKAASYSVSMGKSRTPKRPPLDLPEVKTAEEADVPDKALNDEKPVYFSQSTSALDLTVEADGDHEDVSEPDAAPFHMGAAKEGELQPAAADGPDIQDKHDPISEQNSEIDLEPLDLVSEAEEPLFPEKNQDEFPLDTGSLSQTPPVQFGGLQRPLVTENAGDDGQGEQGKGGEQDDDLSGKTLFERMANLSRSNSLDDEDSDEENEGTDAGHSSPNIPRFLGRQNNQ